MIAAPHAGETTLPAPLLDVMKAAVETTFQSILGERPVHQSSADPTPASGGIVGIISFLGDLTWSFSLILPDKTASALIQKFVGFDIPYDSSDMADAVGELANVLAGDVVARLESRRVKTQMSLPTVARGSDVELISPGGLPTARMFFTSTLGRFWFKLAAAKQATGMGRETGK